MNPWENAFTTTARGTFSPHFCPWRSPFGARSDLSKAVSGGQRKNGLMPGISSHSIGLYAHDHEAVGAFFQYGFGLRCVDAIRSMTPVKAPMCEGFSFFEVPDLVPQSGRATAPDAACSF